MRQSSRQTKREREALGHTCDVSQLVRGVCGRTCDRRFQQKPYAIDCVLAYLDTWGSREVLLKADNEPAIQTLVDAVRSERTMVEKSPKYSHQSNGAVENAVRRIESLTRTYVCVLQEKLGYKVDS